MSNDVYPYQNTQVTYGLENGPMATQQHYDNQPQASYTAYTPAYYSVESRTPYVPNGETVAPIGDGVSVSQSPMGVEDWQVADADARSRGAMENYKEYQQLVGSMGNTSAVNKVSSDGGSKVENAENRAENSSSGSGSSCEFKTLFNKYFSLIGYHRWLT